MRTLIESYQSLPGEHCGSVAMRGLLRHYCGLEISEDAVFGLGSGVDCIYLSGAAMDPAAVIFGRTITMEVDVAAALDVDYREQPEPDDEKAWTDVREEVLAGRPTMLSGDILYLDYREYKVHFPGHRFVLVGFDDDIEKAFIADRIRPEPEACSYDALVKSRNPPEGMSTRNLWGRFHSTQMGRSVEDACRFAIERCTERMLGTRYAGLADLQIGAQTSVTSGVAGIRRLAREIPAWARRDDAAWIASYNSRCIEKFGNGGGNFRRMYARFLHWARGLDASLAPADAPGLSSRAADGWTALAATLSAASKDPADPAPWRDAAERTNAIADLEEELFTMLARRS